MRLNFFVFYWARIQRIHHTMKISTYFATPLASLALCVSASATSIAVNFAQNTNQGFAGGELIGPTDIDSSNWNNTIDRDSGSLSAGTKGSLIDSTGTATTATITWSANTVYYNGDGLGNDEAKLAVGYLDDGGSGATFTLSDIPYAQYNVYVLFTSDQNGDYTHGTLTIDGTDYLDGPFNAHGRVTDGTGWVLADGTVYGNYAKVENLSGSSLTVLATKDAGRSPITGVIIQAVPEPSSVALLGLGGLALILRRRK